MPVRFFFFDCVLCIIIMIINNWQNIEEVSLSKNFSAHFTLDTLLGARATVVIKRDKISALCRDYVLRKDKEKKYMCMYKLLTDIVKLHKENQARWYNSDWLGNMMWGMKCEARERDILVWHHFSFAKVTFWWYLTNTKELAMLRYEGKSF